MAIVSWEGHGFGTTSFDRIGHAAQGVSEVGEEDRVVDLPPPLVRDEDSRLPKKREVAGHDREIVGTTGGDLADGGRPPELGEPDQDRHPAGMAQGTKERGIEDGSQIRAALRDRALTSLIHLFHVANIAFFA
jgi:hypothetical protein